MPESDPTTLLERADEIAQIETALAAARAGSGSVVVVQGPAGIGKSSLLAETAALGGSAGFRVLRGRAGHLEHDLAWSVARQLFTGDLMARPDRERDHLLSAAAALARIPLGLADAATGSPSVAGHTEVSSALHGLYWLCSNLAEDAPLLLVVDDVHWADRPSARWLAYVAERVADLPVALALAQRSGEPTLPEIETIAAAGRAVVLVPSPLSAGAGAGLVRSLVGDDASEELCRACHSATGGNPFLLNELAHELVHTGRDAAIIGPEEIRGLTPGAVRRSVLLRLARLSDRARTVALGCAVLGPGRSVVEAAMLLDLGRDEVVAALDELIAADIVDADSPLGFVHPLVRDVIEADATPTRLGELHGTAARVLSTLGQRGDDVAAHLLESAPTNDPWVIEQLTSAAQGAVARAAPDIAVQYLERAIAEQPGARRAELLHQLGRAEAAAGEPAAISHLQEALTTAGGAAERRAVVLDLAPLLIVAGDLEQATTICEQALEEVGDDLEQELRLTVALASGALLDQGLHPAMLRALNRYNPSMEETFNPTSLRDYIFELLARLLSPHASDERSVDLPGPVAGQPTTQRSAELARRALSDGALLRMYPASSPMFWYAPTALMFGDAYDETAEVMTQALDDARRRGSMLGFAMSSSFRSHLYFRMGRLDDSIADGRFALGSDPLRASPVIGAFTTTFLTESLIARGDLDEAQAVIAASGLAGMPPANFPLAMVQYAKGLMALALGDVAEGARLLEGAGPMLDSGGSSAVISWRGPFALSLLAVGRDDEARAYADEDLGRSRSTQSRWALGIALRVNGLVRSDIGLLEEAVEVLTDSGSRLEEARARFALGAALRRDGARLRSVALLDEAATIAANCGARPLLLQARAELEVAGVRRRGEADQPLDDLTPSERRVAAMACDGLSNQAIAQALFVSLRTVETHLTHAYKKLAIHSRSELAGALAAKDEPPAPPTRPV